MLLHALRACSLDNEKACQAASAVHVSKTASCDWLFVDPSEISETRSDLKSTNKLYKGVLSLSYPHPLLFMTV